MNICNEAAITAARKSKKKVDMRYLHFPLSSSLLYYYIITYYFTLLYVTHIMQL